jgi:hypothetical protein
MPWHQSKANPLKVYDERHQQACLCESAELAALIVAAVNGYNGPRKESAARASESKSAVEQAALTYTVQEDNCCGPRLRRALRSEHKPHESWTCPGCGCEWTPEPRGEIVLWSPVVLMEVF